jgi:hypothetical protein
MSARLTSKALSPAGIECLRDGAGAGIPAGGFDGASHFRTPKQISKNS